MWLCNACSSSHLKSRQSTPAGPWANLGWGSTSLWALFPPPMVSVVPMLAIPQFGGEHRCGLRQTGRLFSASITVRSVGYCSAVLGGGDAVSRTLDYGFADFATAQAFTILATKIGTRDAKASQELRQKASELMRRATRAYSALFDKGQGLMVPRSTHGQVSPGFNAIEWGKGYTEGNAWHHSFPPYAITSTAGESHCTCDGVGYVHRGLVSLITNG